MNIITDESKQRINEKYDALVYALKQISMRCPNAFSGLPVVEIIFGACYGAEAFWIPDASGGRPFIFFGVTKHYLKLIKQFQGKML